MEKTYAFVGGFLIFSLLFFRLYAFTKLPLDLLNLQSFQVFCYIVLSIIYLIVILNFYYRCIKKTPEKNTKINKIKLKLASLVEMYGPYAALKMFYLTLHGKFQTTAYNENFLWLTNKLYDKTYKFYKRMYLFFVVIPRIIISTVFLIDIVYYNKFYLLYKLGIIALVPMVFSAFFGILRIYYDVNKDCIDVLDFFETEIDGEIKCAYKKDFEEYFTNVVGPVSYFFEILYLPIKRLILPLNTLNVLRKKYSWVTLFTMHCYLIGWLYIIKFNLGLFLE